MNPLIIEALGRDRQRELERRIAASGASVDVVAAPVLRRRHRLTVRLGNALISFGWRLSQPSVVPARRVVGGS